MPEYGPFRGLHDRDSKELIPNNFLEVADNIDFVGKLVCLRPRIELRSETSLSIIKMLDFSRTAVNEDVSSNLLALTGSDDLVEPNRLKDITRDVNLTDNDVTDFSAASFLHRAFILTRNGSVKRNLHYYDGETYREAALEFDDSSLSLAVTTPNSGDVFPGNYHIGYILETDTGYFSVPYGLSNYVDEANPGSIVKVIDGNKALTITADFQGNLPSYVSKVHFVSTSAIPDDSIVYPANSFTYYFIPAGALERDSNGDFPGSREVDYFPPNLFVDVARLEKQDESIKGGDGIAVYGNRLCIWGGEDLSDQSIVRISRVNNPESFSKVDGFIVVAPEVNSPITNVFEFRGELYITKENSTYITRDQAGEPATWPVVTVDEGLGAYLNGISSILSSQGTSLDFVTIGTRAGLCRFDGIYQRPELSWHIERLWAEPKAIVRDPTEKKIYILIDNYIYVCNYVEQRLRWSKWTFSFDVNYIIIDSEGKLNLATPDGIYVVDADAVEVLTATIRTGSLAGGASGATHFGDILINKTAGPLTVEVMGRQLGSQGERSIEDGDGVYRALYAFEDDSAQVEIRATEFFELETINIMTQRIWGVPISG